MPPVLDLPRILLACCDERVWDKAVRMWHILTARLVRKQVNIPGRLRRGRGRRGEAWLGEALRVGGRVGRKGSDAVYFGGKFGRFMGLLQDFISMEAWTCMREMSG